MIDFVLGPQCLVSVEGSGAQWDLKLHLKEPVKPMCCLPFIWKLLSHFLIKAYLFSDWVPDCSVYLGPKSRWKLAELQDRLQKPCKGCASNFWTVSFENLNLHLTCVLYVLTCIFEQS